MPSRFPGLRTLALLGFSGAPFGLTPVSAQQNQMEVLHDLRRDVSEELSKSHPKPVPGVGRYLRPLLLAPGPGNQKDVHDPVVQTAAFTTLAAVPGLGFEGVSSVVPGQPVSAIPPDANLAVGPNHIVQWANMYFAVYDKSGHLLAGPTPGNAFWTGFGGPCETENQGDPIVQYDRQADRWIMTQFAHGAGGGPYYQCFAISKTGDPLGQYNRYAFGFSYFNDYTKLGVWPTAYFTSHNMYLPLGGSLFPLGAEVCAYDRAAMLQGAQATAICFQINNKLSLLPVDLDGGTPPPNGSPGYFVNYGGDYASLNLWQYSPNFANPSASVLSAPRSVAAAAFSLACSNGATCVPQNGVTQQLATLGDRMMYRLAYRRFADHESLVVNQTVAAGNTVGIRWYEIRDPGGSPAVFQQGTYAPGSSYRWMGSIAMDQAGDIAIGYSRSDSTMNPGIYLTGRTAQDPQGQMQAEQQIIAGTGSQTDYDRWGDYTAMRIDPADDCTFWYTNEYLTENGSFNWHTRIASFKFDSCNPSTSPDFQISLSPQSNSVVTGTPATYSVSASPLNGFSGDVQLSLTGVASGATATFSPAVLVGGSGSSTLTISNIGSGNYSVNVTGTSGSLVHSAQSALAVTDFTVSAAPASQQITAGSNALYTVTVGSVNAFAGVVTLSAGSLPPGATASFNPAMVTGSGTSTLTIAGAATGNYNISIGGNNGSLKHSTSVGLTVTAPDFTIAATPSSRSVLGGVTAQYNVSLTALNGFAGLVALSVTGAPSGSSVSFSPATVTGTGSSVLSVTPPASAAGNFTLNISGTSGGVTHATTATLAVTNFSVSVSPSSRTVAGGKKTTYTVTVTSINGFTGPVTLAVAGQPANTTVAFSPQPVAPAAGGSATSTMSITPPKAAAAGTYALGVSGTNSGAVRTAAAVNLVVK